MPSPRHRRPRQFQDDSSSSSEQPSAMLLPESLPQSSVRPSSDVISESSSGQSLDQNNLRSPYKDNAPVLARRSIDSPLDTQLSSAHQKWWLRTRLVTTILVNMGNIMERADEQILPALYGFVAASFHIGPTQLGYLTLSRALVQAVASPLGGVLGHNFNRVWVITGGCLLWGVMTGGFSLCTVLWQGMVLSAINGVGLSLVIPNAQSITADYYDELDRGKAFGALYMTSALGGAFGSLYATNQGGYTPFGIEGWRVVFLTVGVISFALGILNYFFAHDPRYAQDNKSVLKEHQHSMSFSGAIAEMKRIVVIPSFAIIILQGVAGSIPFQALVFFTLYFQLLGFSNFAASALMSGFLFATAFGGLLGGWIGDKAAAKYPNHGRIVVTQLSIGVGIPMTILLLKGLPYDATSAMAVVYGSLLAVMGVLISWAAPACNNPIFAEIVPPHLRNMIYSFDRSFEMALAACASPLVGFLAEKVFGFKGAAAAGEGGGTEPDQGEDLTKAKALGNALLVCLVVPWTICLIVYTGLHFTYPKDKQRAKDVKDKLVAAHDVEAHGGSSQQHQAILEQPVDESRPLIAGNGQRS
ncbi:TPA: hypothetical protein ACH3X2_001115 [Trebouxia sp. C0005]